MISESLVAVWAVESMRYPLQQFVDVFESLGSFGLWNPWVSRDSSSVVICEFLRLFGLSNLMVTRDTSSLLISESLRAVWAVESMRHP
jgi:hypothetical protein